MSENNEQIIWTIKNGEFDAVQSTFQNDVQKVNQEIKGRFPLHYAADFGQLKVLKFLIEMGADVNKSDKHGITPLLAAVWEGHTSCVQLLLEKGANKNGSTPDGQSYLEAAEKEEIRNLLFKA
ncbi:myotrophin [Scaptodrosophila lebanonensis]|uniref:Myotrophin n=1 Tax=Drosophila lebanonensis TaxID=7225 RepID=A0A6J2UA03_DROLE|nr:myotrophin [Scaptodrosophila lebanonensis]